MKKYSITLHNTVLYFQHLSLTLFLFCTPLFSAETLIDNLIEGDFTTQIKIDSSTHSPYGEDYTARNKLMLFIFQANPLSDLSLEAKFQANSFINRYETYDNMLYYTHALYSGSTPFLTYDFMATFYIKENERILAQNNQNTNAFGIKAAFNIENIETYFAYSRVSKGTLNAYSALDTHKQLLPTNSILYDANYQQGTKAYALNIAYIFSDSIQLGTRYVLMGREADITVYSGIYSSLLLDEFIRDFALKISFDKAYFENVDEKMRFDFSIQY